LLFVESGGKYRLLVTLHLTSVQLGNIDERALLRRHYGLDPTEDIRFGSLSAMPDGILRV
jgi:hypothetical protein